MQPNILDLYHGDNRDKAAIDFVMLESAGIWGIIHKASQGTHYIDKLCASRAVAANDAGLLVGFYHFLDASHAEDQATNFLECIAKVFPQKLPDAGILIAADFEKGADGNHPALHQLYDFMSFVDKQGPPGSLSVCYSSDLIRDTLVENKQPGSALSGVSDFFRQHRLWLAEYGPHENPPWPWKEQGAWLWQYKDTGRVPAILGNVDLNYFAGTRDELKTQWAMGNGMNSSLTTAKAARGVMPA